ncbi:hypothetical protein [Colwellia sp. RSH04]|uniref:hypothetical protein n=1 Tax=Colwellia sp. RSH04 TaxID=2305464 RepID=UPI000E58F9BA|nr:hypothetical protein [Colwellia sp. RSH04]RHW77435.1 hypothetical protein D1094_00270 [Colwellia sp. RSH04]
MKSFKLLLASSIMTLALCASFHVLAGQPLAVQPVIINAKTKIISYNNLTTSSNNTALAVTSLGFSQHKTIENLTPSPSRVINNQHNQFFEAAVNFNETLQQVISFFSAPDETLTVEPELTQQEIEEEVSITKCKASYS